MKIIASHSSLSIGSVILFVVLVLQAVESMHLSGGGHGCCIRMYARGLKLPCYELSSINRIVMES